MVLTEVCFCKKSKKIQKRTLCFAKGVQHAKFFRNQLKYRCVQYRCCFSQFIRLFAKKLIVESCFEKVFNSGEFFTPFLN